MRKALLTENEQLQLKNAVLQRKLSENEYKTALKSEQDYCLALAMKYELTGMDMYISADGTELIAPSMPAMLEAASKHELPNDNKAIKLVSSKTKKNGRKASRA